MDKLIMKISANIMPNNNSASLLQKYNTGKSAIAELYEDKLVITETSGIFSRPKPITVLIKDINNVDIGRDDLFLIRGQINIAYSNTSVSLAYPRDKGPQMEKFRERILERKAIIEGKPVAKDGIAMSPAGDKTLDEVRMLADLRDKGILTEDEFQAKKKMILFKGQGDTYHEKEIIREIVKVPCPYCGALYEVTAAKCPTCGAPYKK